MLDEALRLAELGYSVIPVRPGAKRPRVSWEPYQTEPASIEQVEEWWGEEPDSGIAIITGRGLIAIDVDKPNNPWPEDPEQRAELGAGPIIQTGGGGRHYLFRTSEDLRNTAGTLAKNVDTRAAGGYIVVPPSVHPSGVQYKWAPGHELEDAIDDLPELPEFILTALMGTGEVVGGRSSSEYAQLLRGVGEGQRDHTCAVLCGRYFARGLEFDEVLDLMLGWNMRNAPPMKESQVRKVVDSIYRREQLKRGGSVPAPETPAEVSQVLDALSDKFDVRMTSVERVGGDSPYYKIWFGEVPVRVPAKEMSSFNKFSQSVIEACNRMPRQLDREERWSDFANMIMSLAVDKEVSSETTAIGLLFQNIRIYLETHEPRSDTECLTPMDPIKINDGEVAISNRDFVKYISRVTGERVTQAEVARLFGELGWPTDRVRGQIESTKEKFRNRRTIVRLSEMGDHDE